MNTTDHQQQQSDRDVSAHVMRAIQHRHLAPRARWQFVLHRAMLWTVTIVLLFLAGIAIGTIISIVRNSDWQFYQEIGHVPRPVFFLLMSYAWILLLLGCVIGCIVAFLHTRHGYRYARWHVVAASIGIVALIGVGVFFAGIGHRIDDHLDRRVPAYGRFIAPHHRLMMPYPPPPPPRQ